MTTDTIDPRDARLIELESLQALPEGAMKKAATAVMRTHLRVTDDGRVLTPDGETPAQLAEKLSADPDYAAVFGGSNGTGGGAPSWEGKKYSEMTRREKIEYLGEKYGDKDNE